MKMDDDELDMSGISIIFKNGSDMVKDGWCEIISEFIWEVDKDETKN